MSRVILARHENGEQRVTCGWDRPLTTGYVDVYDADGEELATFGPLSGESLGAARTAEIAALHMRRQGLAFTVEDERRLRDLLFRHMGLEYPESNVVEDWTRDGS